MEDLFMKKLIFILCFIISLFSLFSQDLTSDQAGDYFNINYLPRIIKVPVFERDILDNITDPEDREYVLKYYFRGGPKVSYYLKWYKPKNELLKLYNIIYSYNKTHGVLALEKAKYEYENDYPVFSQKGGMLRPLDHSFYFRTDDEWTGFSTIFLGYRFAPAEYFNFSIEGGIGLPQLYIASVILHLKMYENPNKMFFMGLRGRIGYKYQHADAVMFSYDADTGESLGYMGLGRDYLTIQNRHSFYFAVDFTVALRFGRLKNHCLYYTIFPKVDFNLQGGMPHILFCPVMAGYEVRFGPRMDWSFAVEAGYTFPIPWNSVPHGEWINFPSLANVSVNFRFGDKFYMKENKNRIYNEAMAE